MAGLRAGCLPLALEVGRYTGPVVIECGDCVIVGRWRISITSAPHIVFTFRYSYGFMFV